MTAMFAWFALKWRAFNEYLIKTFRQQRSPYAAVTSTARAALAALSLMYNGYVSGDEEPLAGIRGVNKNFGLDLERLMLEGKIEAMVVLILGKINSRKTTLAKAMLLLRLKISFGGRQARAIVDDVIVRNGVTEWDSTAKALHVVPVQMHEPFNPLSSSYGMSRNEHMVTVEELIVAGGRQALTGKRDYAARVCFVKMYREYPLQASMLTFSDTLKKLTVEDVKKHGEVVDKEFADSTRAEAKKTGIPIPEALEELMSRPSNINPEEVVAASLEVFYDLDKVLQSPLGFMFSGTETFVEKLQQRLVVLNYTQLMQYPAGVALVKRFMHRLLESAKIRDDKRFMFQTEISDEAYRMLRIGDEAVETSNDIKGIRSSNKAKIILSQRSRDFEVIGNQGSIQQNASSNLFGDVSVFFIGRQGKKDIAHLAEHIELTEEEKIVIFHQLPGQFLVKIGDMPGIPIDTNVMYTNSLASISQSNGALIDALERDIVRDDTFAQLEPEGETSGQTTVAAG